MTTYKSKHFEVLELQPRSAKLKCTSTPCITDTIIDALRQFSDTSVVQDGDCLSVISTDECTPITSCLSTIETDLFNESFGSTALISYLQESGTHQLLRLHLERLQTTYPPTLKNLDNSFDASPYSMDKETLQHYEDVIYREGLYGLIKIQAGYDLVKYDSILHGFKESNISIDSTFHEIALLGTYATRFINPNNIHVTTIHTDGFNQDFYVNDQYFSIATISPVDNQYRIAIIGSDDSSYSLYSTNLKHAEWVLQTLKSLPLVWFEHLNQLGFKFTN